MRLLKGRMRGSVFGTVRVVVLRLLCATLKTNLRIESLRNDLPGLLAKRGGLGSGVARCSVSVAVAREHLLAHEAFDGFQRAPARRPVGI